MHCLIRQWRQQRGMTQASLAQAVGRSRSSIAEYEAGRKGVPHPVLWAIARVLGVRVDALFEDREEQRK